MRIRLTKEGYEKLKQELELLSTVKRREIARALEHARAKGDLSENAEYDAAKDEQAHLEKRIHELQAKLANAVIIDADEIRTDKAFLGARITLADLVKGDEIVYTLVSKEEADLKQKKISVDSPVGRAILGRAVGEKVEVTIPAGVLKYKVVRIER